MLGNTAPIIVDAAIQHSASMIFLHGLGDTGYGWIPVMRQLAKKFRFMKFICPNAYYFIVFMVKSNSLIIVPIVKLPLMVEW